MAGRRDRHFGWSRLGRIWLPPARHRMRKDSNPELRRMLRGHEKDFPGSVRRTIRVQLPGVYAADVALLLAKRVLDVVGLARMRIRRRGLFVGLERRQFRPLAVRRPPPVQIFRELAHLRAMRETRLLGAPAITKPRRGNNHGPDGLVGQRGGSGDGNDGCGLENDAKSSSASKHGSFWKMGSGSPIDRPADFGSIWVLRVLKPEG